MQEKAIKSVLRKKFHDWVKSIDNESLRDLIKRDAIVTGGAIPSLLVGEKPNDFDFYFKNLETTKAIAEYYVSKFKLNPPSKFKNGKGEVDVKVLVQDSRVKIIVQSQGIAGESGTDDYQYFEQPNLDPSEPQEFVEEIVKDMKPEKKPTGATDPPLPKYRPVFLTSNAITLSDAVQIVVRFYGPVDQIHENYDFIHCTCSWDAQTGELILPNAALLSIINKRLKYKTSKYPLCSLIRTRKFLKAGWHIDAGQYVKMAWDLNELDLKDVKVLEDQMVGVDAAYFREVVELLNEKTENGTKPIEDSYVIEVIDRVFG